MRPARLLLPLAALTLVLGACSDDGDDSAATTLTTAATTTTPPTTGTTVAGPPTSGTAAPSTATTTPPPAPGGGGGTPATTIPYDPGEPCTLGTNRDCIDPDGTGQGVYLIGGADCVASAQANGVGTEICVDLDRDGRAGYPDSG